MLHVPGDLHGLFGGSYGSTLVVAASQAARRHVVVSTRLAFRVLEVSDDFDELRGLLDSLASEGQRTSVVWVSEREYEHFDPEDISLAKVVAFSFFSVGFSPGVFSDMVEVVVATDYEAQARRESRVLDILDRSESLLFQSSGGVPRAEFNHWSCPHWFSLNGSLEFGDQCVLPTGEISALTDRSSIFTEDSHFDLNGQLQLECVPVVHRGSDETSLAEVALEFDRLRLLSAAPCLATVVDGVIVDVTPSGLDHRGCRSLLSLLERDSSYRKIHEIGLGTNSATGPLRDTNYFPNERFPAVHFGLGLGGTTRLHVDLVCPEIGLIGVGEDGRTRAII